MALFACKNGTISEGNNACKLITNSNATISKSGNVITITFNEALNFDPTVASGQIVVSSGSDSGSIDVIYIKDVLNTGWVWRGSGGITGGSVTSLNRNSLVYTVSATVYSPTTFNIFITAQE